MKFHWNLGSLVMCSKSCILFPIIFTFARSGNYDSNLQLINLLWVRSIDSSCYIFSSPSMRYNPELVIERCLIFFGSSLKLIFGQWSRFNVSISKQSTNPKCVIPSKSFAINSLPLINGANVLIMFSKYWLRSLFEFSVFMSSFTFSSDVPGVRHFLKSFCSGTYYYWSH